MNTVRYLVEEKDAAIDINVAPMIHSKCSRTELVVVVVVVVVIIVVLYPSSSSTFDSRAW